jgi:hypothetical protein
VEVEHPEEEVSGLGLKVKDLEANVAVGHPGPAGQYFKEQLWPL